MSITDLIVELLEKGKWIEIEGIGTLGSVMQNAHHDPATQTYYPAGRTVAYYGDIKGDTDIIQVLAEHECVNSDVARQMWKNYVDALCDKMQRTGAHTFGRLGDLTYNAEGGYGFNAAKGVVLEADNKGERPIEGVRTYSHEGEADPFAQFEAPAPAKPVHIEDENTAAILAAREAVRAEKAAAEKAKAEQLAAEKAAAEKAEAERIAAEKAAAEKAEAERIAAEKAAAEKAEAERIAAEKAAAEKAEAERVAAEKAAAEKAEAERIAAEKAAAEKAEAERIAAEKKQLEQLESMSESNTVKENEPTKEADDDNDKKRSRWWLWLLLALLLLALAAGGYYYFTHYSKTVDEEVSAEPRKHLEGVGAVNSLTYNTDMIEYSQRNMRRHSELVNQFMFEYIDEYLAARGYRSARVQLIDRVQQYSAKRIAELLGPRFAVQRLIPYNDYIYHYNEPFLKETRGKHARVAVQTELMNGGILDSLLQVVVREYGLTPDVGAVRTVEPQPTAKQNGPKPVVKKAEEEPLNVYVEKGSKQGFDLIAGFYLDKAKAARMSGRLHALGCDAYIIEFGNMYYVSMGSASSQTAADALLKHVKSWYDGDVVIKKW